jgi:ribonucleoside-diphosphate reductase alpha chain
VNKIKALFDKLSAGLKVDFDSFYKELKKYLINNIETKKILDLSAKAAIDNISVQNIDWQTLAGRYILADLYKEATKNRGISMDQIYTPQAYLDLFKKYIDLGYYNSHFFKFYTEDDILEAGKYLNKERDYSYGFTTLNMYRKRYLLNPNGVIFELPQEMYMSAALFLAIPEGLYILHKKLLNEDYNEVEVPEDLLNIVRNSPSDYEIIKK